MPHRCSADRNCRLPNMQKPENWPPPKVPPLFKMADMEQIYLRAYVTSEQLSEVKLGRRVTVYADYGKDVRTAYPGVVTWISDSSEFTPKNDSYEKMNVPIWYMPLKWP